MTRVFVADDHYIVRIGLRQVLAELGGFEIVGEAETGRQVLDAPELAVCDVLVLDLSLPVISGMEVLRRLRASHPHLAIVVHTMHPEDQFRRRVLAEGAAAYVSKERPPSELIQAVRHAARRPEQAAPPPEAEAEATPAAEPLHARLTQREHQVFALIIRGSQVADIAAELDVHSCTVSNHLAKVRAKLGARTVADIVRYAYAEGLIDAPLTPGDDAQPD